MKKNLLKPEAIHLETGMLSSLPPRPEEEAARAALVALRKAGKQVIPVCCNACKGILQAALQIGVTQAEFDLLLNFFRGHKVTDSTYYAMKGKPFLPEAVETIFETAALLEGEALQQHFRKAAFEDVQARNKSAHKAAGLLKFNKLWREKEAAGSRKLKGIPKAAPTFEDLFADASAMEELLAAMRKLELIDGKGALIAGKRKAPLWAAWDVVIYLGMINDSSFSACQTFFSYFKEPVSNSAFYAVRPKSHYPELKRQLLARIKWKK